MASRTLKPLVSAQTGPTRDQQFKHFGVLNDGKQDPKSVFTSLTVNVLLALIVCIVGAAAKKTYDDNQKAIQLTYLEEPPKPQPKPKVMPKPLPKTPVIKPEPPKIKLPEVKLPEIPKQPTVRMAQPTPVLVPAPPKLVQAPPAPKPVNLAATPQAAAIANNTVPSPIRLGQMDNPIKNNNGPAVSKVNLGQAGAPGMPASNTGLGAVSKVNLGGNGQPTGTNMKGNGVQAVQGVRLGVAGGNGPLNSTGRAAGPVNLAQAPPPPSPGRPTGAATNPMASNAPKVIYKPKPEYTADAMAKHIEGTITVRVHVSSSGAVQVLGVVNDLGYGLGNSALRAVQGTRFQPATDAQGHPVDWEGMVNVVFQLAG